MKKIITLLIFVCTLCLLLVSCNNNSQTSGGGQNNQNNQADTINKNVVYTIVPETDTVPTETLYRLADRLTKATGMKFAVGDDVNIFVKYAIWIGETTSDMSDMAYRYLTDVYEYEDNFVEAGYVFYRKDDAIAVAYNACGMDPAFDALVENFSEYMNGNKSGVVGHGKVDITEYLDAFRKQQLDENLAKLEGKLDAEVINALRDFYSLYDEGLYIWAANLFDPETGSFYYSNSARNSLGYGTDLESTRQIIDFIGDSGLMADYGRDYYKFLSAEDKATLAEWVQGLQNSSDGYFYHPQWGTTANNARKNRDLEWATTILNNLGVAPYYNTPNGIRGYLPKSVAPTSVTTPVTSSAATVASKVVAAADSNSKLPAHLQSTTAWLEYIESWDWEHNSYGAGNDIAAQHDTIEAAGPEYVEILMNWLNDHQNPENGLWESTVTYASVNGLMKISSIYNYLGYDLNHIEKALDSTLQIALTPDFTAGDEHVCSIYNVWVCLRHILQSASSAEQKAELQQKIMDNAVDLINVSRDKLSIFKVDDGSFSYFRGRSSDLSQGQPVAVPNTYEGDANATVISANSLRGSILLTLGIAVEDMPIFTPEDGHYFVSMLRSMGVIIKDTGEPVNTETFNDFDEGEWLSNMSNEVTIQDLGSNAAVLTIKNNSHGNKYLEYVKNSTSSGGRLSFTKTDKTEAGAVVFQTKVKYNHLSYSTNCSYFRFYDKAGKQINFANGAYYFSGASGSEVGALTLGGVDIGVKEGEWFTLTFRFTNDKLEIFVNGTLFKSFDAVGIHKVHQVRIQSDPNMTFKAEFDNVYFGSEEYMEYPNDDNLLENDPVEEDNGGGGDAGDNTDTDEVKLPTDTEGFDGLDKDSVWSSDMVEDVKIQVVNPGATDTVTVRDEGGNKYLEYDKNSSSKGIFEFHNISGTTPGESVVFQARMRINHISETDNCSFFVFWSLNESGGYKSQYKINEGDGFYYFSAVEKEGSDKRVLTLGGQETGVAEGEWFTLTFKITKDKLRVYINGELFKTLNITGIDNATVVRYQSEPGMNHKTDVDDVYFGAEGGNGGTTNPDSDTVGIPDTLEGFDGINKDTVWSPELTDDLKIQDISKNNSTATTVREEDTNKYLEYNKTGSGRGIFEFFNTSGTAITDTVIFHAKMRFSDPSNVNFASFIFYSLKDDGSYQTPYYPNGSNNYYISVNDNGNVTIGGKDTGVKEGEWFTLTFKITTDKLKVFVDGELFGTYNVTGIQNAKVVRMQSVVDDRLYKADFDDVYFGLEGDNVSGGEGNTDSDTIVQPESPEGFDSVAKDTAWSPELSDELKIQNISKNNSATATVREEDTNKYLEYNKTGSGRGIFEFFDTSSTGSDVIFQAKMRFSDPSNVNFATFIFYSLKDDGSYQTPYYPSGSNNYYISVNDNGNVTIGGKDTGVKEGEWFTLTFKITTDNLKVFVNGEIFGTYNVTGIHNAKVVRIQSVVDDRLYKADFDDVYFGDNA